MECIKCKAQIPDGSAFCNMCGKPQTPQKRKHKKRANGTGNISKLSGSRAKPWMVRKGDAFVGTYETRQEAQRALDRLTDIAVSEKFNMTFAEIYAQWLPEHEREITKSGKTGYTSAYKYCDQLYDRKFRTLRASDFQRVIIDMEGKGLSKSSCEKAMQLFGQLSSWAMREDIIVKDYSRFVSTVAKQKSEGIVLKPEEIQKIQKSSCVAADIVLILLATGCRPGELFGAATENCYDNYFIGGSKTEAGKNRVIPVAQIGMEAYKRILQKATEKNSPLLIGGYSGNKSYGNFVKREFKELAQEVGGNWTPYDCRHTFATQAKRSGVDPQTLRRMLGHASLHTTDKYYTHLDIDDILAGINQMKYT